MQEEESEIVFREHVASAEDSITFEEFVTFMIERAQDKETPEQVRAAFKLIASNKVRRACAAARRPLDVTGARALQDHVLISELAPYVDTDKMAWIVKNAPAKAGVADAIDIEAFVQSSFST